MNITDLQIANTIGIAYLVAATLFFLGLKRLGSPATARSGNILAAVGMFIAVVVTLLDRGVLNYGLIVAGIVLGGAIGLVMARWVKMTDMPQLVAVFNGFGGAASAVIAASEFVRLERAGIDASLEVASAIMLSALIGLVTFSGSMIAYARLQGIMGSRPTIFPLQRIVSTGLFLAIVALMVYLVVAPDLPLFAVLGVACLVLGVALVIPIGGGDMPVVISLLNSYSGLAAAVAGFVLGNMMLIVAGSLVGAAGFILTMIMCRAMNRSIANVMFGAFGALAPSAAGAAAGARPVREVTADEAAIILAYAKTAIFAPGYGLAVAQAQHVLKELGVALEARGVEVKYAIHPVAGRMPGHMNVLLAEADVPYDKLYDLDQISDDFPNTDVCLVIGANDVVNPAARESPDSPIFGMPILNADYSHHVIVLKRSMAAGFAGIDNELFYKTNTSMLFGDAKASLTKLVAEVKEA